MESISLERLLFLAVFLLIPLFQLIRRWLGQPSERAGPREPARATAPERPSRVRATPPRRRAGPLRPEATLPQTLPAASSPPWRRPLFRLGTPRDARQLIIAMTVLGPCRALEPPGPSAGGPDR